MFQCVYLFALFVYFRIHYNVKLQNLIFLVPSLSSVHLWYTDLQEPMTLDYTLRV